MSNDSIFGGGLPASSNETGGPNIQGLTAPDCTKYVSNSYVQVPAQTAAAFGLATSLVVMNLLVIVFMGWSLLRAQTQNIPKLLVVLLAVTDLSLGSFSVGVQAFRYWWGYCETGGHAVCVMQAFAHNVIIVSSSLIVVLMSVERYCALRMPFRYNTTFTMRNTLFILAGILLYSVALATLPLLGVNKYDFGGFGCDFEWRATSRTATAFNYYFGLQGLLLMPIIVGLNVSVLREIYRMTAVAPAAPAGSEKDSGPDAASVQLQRRFAVLTLMASAAFIICNTPILVRLVQYQNNTVNSNIPDYVIKRLHISNSLVNPCLSLFFYLSNLKWKVIFGCEKATA